MARLHTCGFEENNLTSTMWRTASGTVSVVTTPTPHSGTYILSQKGGATQRRLPGVKTSGTVFFRSYVRFGGSAGIDSGFLQLRSDGGNVSQSLVRVTGTSKIKLTNTAGGVEPTTTAVFANDTWYRCEMRVVISNTVGEVEARLYEGDSLTPIETLQIGNLDTDTINTGSNGVFDFECAEGSNGVTFFFDDVIVNDDTGSAPFNTWPGPSKIAFKTTASVNSAGWEDGATGSPGAGNVNATNLDELPGAAPDDATTFNREDDTLNVVDRLNPTTLPAAVPANAKMIAMDIYARVGSDQTLTNQMRLKLWDEGGNLTDGPAVECNVSGWKILSTAEHLAFALGARSKANVEDFDIGYESLTQATRRKDITALWANVEWIEPGAIAPTVGSVVLTGAAPSPVLSNVITPVTP